MGQHHLARIFNRVKMAHGPSGRQPGLPRHIESTAYANSSRGHPSTCELRHRHRRGVWRRNKQRSCRTWSNDFQDCVFAKRPAGTPPVVSTSQLFLQHLNSLPPTTADLRDCSGLRRVSNLASNLSTSLDARYVAGDARILRAWGCHHPTPMMGPCKTRLDQQATGTGRRGVFHDGSIALQSGL